MLVDAGRRDAMFSTRRHVSTRTFNRGDFFFTKLSTAVYLQTTSLPAFFKCTILTSAMDSVAQGPSSTSVRKLRQQLLFRVRLSCSYASCRTNGA